MNTAATQFIRSRYRRRCDLRTVRQSQTLARHFNKLVHQQIRGNLAQLGSLSPADMLRMERLNHLYEKSVMRYMRRSDAYEAFVNYKIGFLK